MPNSEPPKEAQAAAAVLMVRPAHFAFNPQTAPSNSFQHAIAARSARTRGAVAAPSDLERLALEEFDALAESLRRAGVHVIVAEDTDEPVKPDAIFPNNWVSFHRDGTVVLYPLLAPNRRSERREEVIRGVIEQGSFRIVRTVDLSYRESQGKFLEGTGSLVLDRPQRVAYASLSPRTDLDVLGEFAQQLDYELVTFEAFDHPAKPLYHTNVMMAIGATFAVVCAESIAGRRHRDDVHSRLEAAGHEVIEITRSQMREFAGNLLELSPARSPLIALSTRAWRSLHARQRRQLEKHGNILAADIPHIERHGGGGVRCMLAEIHLPRRI
ncbi:MAG TPA: arginine deiminase-related protein [Steroidobacteraceae bacterium]|nr:arginine deiminase-related protein [Steroidobacteraceae bacterium]